METGRLGDDGVARSEPEVTVGWGGVAWVEPELTVGWGNTAIISWTLAA